MLASSITALLLVLRWSLHRNELRKNDKSGRPDSLVELASGFAFAFYLHSFLENIIFFF